jgi:hypothetical protein
MKIIFDATRKDACDYAVHKQVWGDFKVIYGHYHSNIPKINWNSPSTVFNWGNISDNFIKRFSVNDLYVNGMTFTLNNKDYEAPKGSYFRYDNNLQLQLCYKNEVCTIDGLVFDKIELKKQGLYKVDKDAYFTDMYKSKNGYYHLVGYLLDDTQATGLVSIIEYATIQNHVYEPQTITIKDVDGHCILVGSGDINCEWVEDGETLKRNFQAGTVIILSDKDIKITGGSDDYNVYEFYAVKDKTALYDLYNNK